MQAARKLSISRSLPIDQFSSADLSKVPRMVLVHHNPVVVLSTSVTPTSRMFPVLSNTAMARADVTPLLPVLPETCSATTSNPTSASLDNGPGPQHAVGKLNNTSCSWTCKMDVDVDAKCTRTVEERHMWEPAIADHQPIGSSIRKTGLTGRHVKSRSPRSSSEAIEDLAALLSFGNDHSPVSPVKPLSRVACWASEHSTTGRHWPGACDQPFDNVLSPTCSQKGGL